ncbi:polysaccharide deacetylase family protein [Flavobacteriales bacterium]|nr:polysaccharide deacetylase family protein [Flavobacteriales bacterium]
MSNSRLSYFIDNFELAYSCKLDWNELNIGYDDSCQIILAKPEIDNPLEDADSIVWKNWKGTVIPFIMNKKDEESIYSQTSDNKITINFDIVSSACYLMSGRQEIETKNRDQYGRFKFEESIQKKLNIVGVPVVNYYFEILKEAIEIITKSKIKSKRNFSATITHDIDEVTSGWKHRVRTELNNKSYLKAISHGLSQPTKPFLPWKNLKELSGFNSENNVPTTFFLLARNNKVDNIKNADYSLSSPYIKESISEIKKNGHEVGAHGSYKTHESNEELQKDIKSFKDKVKGNRFHFLQYSIQESSEVIESNGLKFDSTLGFQEEIGFRNSICTPFKLYNFKENRSFDFIEIPLNIMDCSLEYTHYMSLSPTESLEAIKKLSKEIKKFNGNICINWHNTYFSDYLKSDWKTLYKEIIGFLKEENCEFNTCSQLIK